MTYDVIVGIAKKLKTFGLPIYVDEVKQDLETPSFFIDLLAHTHTLFLGNRYYRTQTFDIVYFPSEDVVSNAEILSVTDELDYLLEYITLTDNTTLRGINLRHETVDNVLHFFLDYNFFVYKKEETLNMEELQAKLGVE